MPFSEFFSSSEETLLFGHLRSFQDVLQRFEQGVQNGRRAQWEAVLNKCSGIRAEKVELNRDLVLIGDAEELDSESQKALFQNLHELKPWRKGPFSVFGIHIDTEWRSDWKWQRLENHIQPLKNRLVLDVGCGSGYHCWRMRGEGASQVLGVDPTALFWMQFRLMKQLIGPEPVDVLPLSLEATPQNLGVFDTVFSMGVLYHRRDHGEHLRALHGMLRPGGELVLETLVVEGPRGHVLVPPGRYVMMRNVWALPSPLTIEDWLTKEGFRNIRMVDMTLTTMEGQRKTAWMVFNSLADNLDPADPKKTVEGHPAPVRAIFIAEK